MLVVGKHMIKRFLIGGLLTAILAFSPLSAFTAISVYGFGNYQKRKISFAPGIPRKSDLLRSIIKVFWL